MRDYEKTVTFSEESNLNQAEEKSNRPFDDSSPSVQAVLGGIKMVLTMFLTPSVNQIVPEELHETLSEQP